MESALFCANLMVTLLLFVWSARGDAAGKLLTGLGLFDTKPGAECDHRPKPIYSFERDI